MEARFFGVNVRGRVLDAEERLPRDAVVRRSLKGVGSGRVQRLRVIVALKCNSFDCDCGWELNGDPLIEVGVKKTL